MIPPLNKILVIEDEPDVQFIIKTVLEKRGGFKVRVCSNGQLAIASITSFSPDLILMDARMPHMNGLTTSRLLREMKETAQIPVIFVTANTQPADMEKYRELGAIGVISKPFEVATLASTVRAYWNARFNSYKAG